jgi:hypothetical protein
MWPSRGAGVDAFQMMAVEWAALLVEIPPLNAHREQWHTLHGPRGIAAVLTHSALSPLSRQFSQSAANAKSGSPSGPAHAGRAAVGRVIRFDLLQKFGQTEAPPALVPHDAVAPGAITLRLYYRIDLCSPTTRASRIAGNNWPQIASRLARLRAIGFTGKISPKLLVVRVEKLK